MTGKAVQAKGSKQVVAAPESVRMEHGEPSFADQMALAATLLKTGFLPKSISTPGQALAIILTGREMGIGPMKSLRSIGIINGKPVMAADLLLELFKRDGGHAKWLVNDPKEVKLWLQHPNGDEHTQAYSMEDASRAELDKNPGRTYQRFPAAMLRARCITAGLRALGYAPATGVYDPSELAVPLDAPEVVAVAQQLPESEPTPDAAEGSEAVAGQPGPIAGPSSVPAADAVWRGRKLSEYATEELMAEQRSLVAAKKPAKFGRVIEAITEVLMQRGAA
jgi:hypothetical protein